MNNVRTEGFSYNFQLSSTGLTQITKRKQNQGGLWSSKEEKMKIINVSEEDLNNGLKEAVCPSLITNSFSQVNVSRN